MVLLVLVGFERRWSLLEGTWPVGPNGSVLE